MFSRQSDLIFMFEVEVIDAADQCLESLFLAEGSGKRRNEGGFSGALDAV